MIVALHQPHFLAWLGYLESMVRADPFIVLGHVQFERRNYQNRTRILLNDHTVDVLFNHGPHSRNFLNGTIATYHSSVATTQRELAHA